MSDDQLDRNPGVDYTKYPHSLLELHSSDSFKKHDRPDLITLVFSDIGILTPDGVSQYLVGMFAG